MANSFCVGTLNVRGLNNKLKRRALFNYLRRHKVDIACLQETYIKSDTLHDIKREWRGQVFHRHGTSRSNGLLTLIGTKLMNEETELVKETDRILIIKITINNVVHTVVNCYAPNTTIEKINFLHQLQEELQDIETDSLWVTGDFNIALEQADNIAGRPHHQREVATFKDTLAHLDIFDVWRANNSDIKEYTWSRPTPFTARRIDYILCDSTSLTKTTTSSIESFPHSDHKLVKAHVIINNFKRGPGFWKFNSPLLSETEFVNEAETFIETHFEEYQNDNPIAAWEMFKFKFKSFCLQYTSNRSKNKKNIIQKLILELNKTEQQLASEPQNRELQRQTLHLKKHLELQEMKQIQGAQVRSRLRWIEEGEKTQNTFLDKKNTEVPQTPYPICRSEVVKQTTLQQFLVKLDPTMKTCTNRTSLQTVVEK